MNGAYVLDWLNLVARWAHLIAGISWIGASFYFVWLDDRLVAPTDPADTARGVSGELWAVHGGGFYHSRKYLTGPRGEPLTENLHWFKWEAYSTWITGVAMLAIVYWAGASTYLIDRSVLDLTPGAAIAISLASLFAGYAGYDALCRIVGARPAALWTAIGLYLLLVDWALFHVFGGRAASIHVGAVVGTIMVANVAHVIIPGQRKMLAQIRAGEPPDPRPGRLGKTRSVHNTYLTLPVLFTMIGSHYPMIYGGRYGWLVLAAIAAAGVLVRRFFVLGHTRRPAVALPVAAALLLIGAAIATAPRGASNAPLASRSASVGSPAASAGATPYALVEPIVRERCAVCHAAHPTQPGFDAAPLGIRLDTPDAVRANAQAIYAQAVTSHAMPLGNLTRMTDAERSLLGAWITDGARP